MPCASIADCLGNNLSLDQKSCADLNEDQRLVDEDQRLTDEYQRLVDEDQRLAEGSGDA